MTDPENWESILAEWSKSVPWRVSEHVLQDLVLSRIIIEFANDRKLSKRLVLHGGTCLHKLWYGTPQRYSEDLDFLCVKPWYLPFVMRRMKRIMREAGLADARFRFRGYPAVAASTVGARAIDLRVDFNPTPRAAKRAFRNRSSHSCMAVQSTWYRGTASRIPCASVTDILASKIAAVMTRAKARDLTDLCMGVAPDTGIVGVDAVVREYLDHYLAARHPTSLEERVDELMEDHDFRAGLDEGGDFIPPGITLGTILASVAAIDQSLARHARCRDR